MVSAMPVESHTIEVSTRGDNQVVDLSAELERCLRKSKVRNGTVTVFVVGSTAGITTTESEPGLMTHDLAAFFEKIAPADGYYKHEETWHDDNGHAHVRASLLGPSVTVPLVDGALALGTWQQIVLIDFDTRPRTRRVIIQIVGD
jgi:secondary thiamine-phosphate synthase enzyme